MISTVAAQIFTALVFLVVIFQAALAVGMPWGKLTWGGRFPGQLPGYMRGVAIISTVLLIAFALVVVIRAGALLPEGQPVSRKLVWVVVAYCVFGVLANTFTPSRWERIVWLPVVLTMLICSLIVAMS